MTATSPSSTTATTATTATTGQELDLLAEQWRSWSDRVFAAAPTDPDAYVRTARLVGAVVEELRSRGRGAEPLLAAWRAHLALVESVAASDHLLTTEGLDTTAVAGAAFALRHREVMHDMAADARRDAIAVLPTEAWSVVEESGYSPGDPYVPYRRLEVHPATGRAIIVTTSADDDYRACVHRVETGRVVPATGELIDTDADVDAFAVSPVHLDSEAEREAYVAALKATARAATEPTPGH